MRKVLVLVGVVLAMANSRGSPGNVHKCRVQWWYRPALCVSDAQMGLGCGDWGTRHLPPGQKLY